MKIIHFADLHLGVENYGSMNPETGLSSRLEDFLKAFDQVVDFALENKVDLVLFCGDAYKTREPTQTQQREFARRLNRLASNGIPVFLLTGNHDLPNAIGRATAIEIFDTLAIRNVYVSNHPEICHIPTNSGMIQIASLPWLRRSALLSREETKNLSFEQINEKLQQVLTDVIDSHARQLDPRHPSVLAAHVWVSGAKVGSENSMSIGQEHALLVSNVANPAFDYIALGHIHKAQVLSQNPPVAYAGSLARVDFSEEADEKGFYLVEIGPGESTGKRRVSIDFRRIDARRFVTIEVDIESQDSDPTDTVLKAIEQKNSDGQIRDAIVRLLIALPAELEVNLRDSDIRNALKEAYHLTIAREVGRSTRLRGSEWAAEAISPLEALKHYLESSKVPRKEAEVMLEYGERLMERQAPD